MVHLTHRVVLLKWDNRAMWGPSGASYGVLDGKRRPRAPGGAGMTAHTRTGAATAVTLADPALTGPFTSTPASQETAMTSATYRHYSGTAAQIYQSFFVPSIATPVSGELLC